MKRTVRMAALVLAAVVCGLGRGAADERGGHGDGHVIVTPDKLQWMPSPVLPTGATVAVVSGNPTKAGEVYALRVKLPDGFKISPHWHPEDENVTVLHGTMLFGVGERFDPSRMMEAPAGSFARMPKGVRHYAMAKGDTVLQVHGVGPFEFNYVNASDDPRKK